MKKCANNEYRRAHYEASDDNDKIILNFLHINRTLHHLYEGRASQKRILIILSEVGTITQQRLTERLGIMPGSASEVLVKLEKNGLITRTENTDDHRTTDITLTDEGRALAKEAFEQRQNRHKEMLSCLSEEEKNKLLSLLEKINDDWEKRYKGSNEDDHHRCHGHHECRDHNAHSEHSEYHKHRGHHGHGEENPKCDGNCSECTHPCHNKNNQNHH